MHALLPHNRDADIFNIRHPESIVGSFLELLRLLMKAPWSLGGFRTVYSLEIFSGFDTGVWIPGIWPTGVQSAQALSGIVEVILPNTAAHGCFRSGQLHQRWAKWPIRRDRAKSVAIGVQISLWPS